MQTIAAIDVGSNGIRMVVGRVDPHRRVRVVENIRLPVRLGTDAFTTGVASEEVIRQAVEALLQFRRIIRDYGVGRIRAVATSAVRELSNQDILLDRIARSAFIEVQVIGGEEEARLVHLAVSHAMDLDGKRALLVDIGGGSVEVTLCKGGEILSTDSYDMGTVRVLEKLGHRNGDPIPFERLAQEYADAAKRHIDRDTGGAKVDVFVGTGGNVEEMGKLRQRLFRRPSDQAITLAELDALTERLKGLTLEERVRQLNLRPDRADVLLPAAIVIRLFAHQAGVKKVFIPKVGLKDGVLQDMAQEIEPGEHPLRPEQVWASAVQLGRKYQFDEQHGRRVAQLAGLLFEETRRIHQLAGESRLLLEVAALLHDVGHFISMINHDQHGYYLLTANYLIGLDERQQAIVANLVRYHRCATSDWDDPVVRPLKQDDRRIAIKLMALMRMADALDSSHTEAVRGVRLRQKQGTLSLKLVGAGDLLLERWAVAKRKALFEETFGVNVKVEDSYA
jgi:exopolyphosphatase/guanosine-5'-triphosphate,3'-diphosphate pyrophosphatase